MNKETICAVVRDLMPSYLDKITEGATNAFIEQHLTECEACRTVKRNMMKITSPAEQAQAEFLDRLRRARVRRARRGWAAAIAVLVVLAPTKKWYLAMLLKMQSRQLHVKLAERIKNMLKK
ncbi:MAG: zf-HC2 domain-containing protein [Clostridia bacterium]|nr:zf-HC2 domain-containing protein [Clostridia bacterium]